MDARSIWAVNQRGQQIIILVFPAPALPALAHKSRLSRHFALNFKLMPQLEETFEWKTPFPMTYTRNRFLSITFNAVIAGKPTERYPETADHNAPCGSVVEGLQGGRTSGVRPKADIRVMLILATGWIGYPIATFTAAFFAPMWGNDVSWWQAGYSSDNTCILCQ